MRGKGNTGELPWEAAFVDLILERTDPRTIIESKTTWTEPMYLLDGMMLLILESLRRGYTRVYPTALPDSTSWSSGYQTLSSSPHRSQSGGY